MLALREAAAALESAGHTVLTRHLLDDNVEAAEATLSERDVFDRDLRWLREADLLIAEASGSSYGVGFEVGYVLGRAEQTGQRVIVLFSVARRPVISRLITGADHPACTTYGYSSTEDLLAFISAALAPVAP